MSDKAKNGRKVRKHIICTFLQTPASVEDQYVTPVSLLVMQNSGQPSTLRISHEMACRVLPDPFSALLMISTSHS